eukprot:1842833-Ditylum_brightwellii.AAC.1
MPAELDQFWGLLPKHMLQNHLQMSRSLTIHCIHGKGVKDDGIWQQYWNDLTALQATWYHVPPGKVGWIFLNTYSMLIDGCVERKWSSKKFLLFPMVVLQKLKGTNNSHDIRQWINHCLDLWDREEYEQLVEDTISTICRKMPANQ